MDTNKSLLLRAQWAEDSAAWRELFHVYTPLISRWLASFSINESDADDITQEVMLAVTKHLRGFDHNGLQGAFRSWLRNITVNRCRRFWTTRGRQPAATGNSSFLSMMASLEDDKSELSRQWDEEHDAYVLKRLIDHMHIEFDTITMKVFRRTALEGASPAAVAVEMEIPVGRVYKARHRVMERLREEAQGWIEV